MNFTTEGKDELHEEITAEIVDDCFIPACCDNPVVELILVHEEYMHFCTNCESWRPELD